MKNIEQIQDNNSEYFIGTPENYSLAIEQITQQYIENYSTQRILLKKFDRHIEPSRLGPLKAVRSGQNALWATRTSELERLEDKPHPYSPTLGIEIEIPGHTLLHSEEKTLGKKVKRAIIENREKTLQTLVEKGFKRDETDPWWEFAFHPSSSYLTQLAELEALEEAGAIDLEKNFYPIHINIAGITTSGFAGGEAFIIARALEATTWASSSIRLMMPFDRRADSWRTEEGTGGIQERFPEDLMVEETVLEIRTFMAHGKENIAKTLEACFYMAACLSAFQGLNNEEINKTSRNPFSKKALEVKAPFIREGATLEEAVKLAAIWAWFSKEVKVLFDKFELRNPGEAWKEPQNRRFKKTKGDFEGLAQAIDSKIEFVSQVQKLVEILILKTKEIIS